MPEEFKTYTVTWDMLVDAESPLKAAREAWQRMRDPDSIANYFTVIDMHGNITCIDLLEEGTGEKDDES